MQTYFSESNLTEVIKVTWIHWIYTKNIYIKEQTKGFYIRMI